MSNGIGEKLRKARLEQGITFEDVVKDTKIRARFLQALEEEDWDVFPGQVYLKGFLRSYSKYLGLNDAELLEQLKEILPKEQEIINIPRKMELPGRPRRKMGIIYGIIAIILLFAFQYSYTHFINPPVSLPSSTSDPAGEHPDQTSNPPEDYLPAGEQGDAANEEIGFEDINLRLEALEGKCWVRVKDESKVVYEGTLQAGEEKVFTNLLQVEFTLGNAGGVRVYLNEKDYGVLGKAHTVVTKKYVLENKQIVEISS